MNINIYIVFPYVLEKKDNEIKQILFLTIVFFSFSCLCDSDQASYRSVEPGGL